MSPEFWSCDPDCMFVQWPGCMAQSRGSVMEDEAVKMVELCPVKKFGLIL